MIDRVDSSGAKGLPSLSATRPRPREHGLDHSGAREQSRHRQAAEGLGAGVMEVAVRYRTNAWRVVYVTEIGGALWVIHAFQKKSKQGIRTPKPDMDLVRSRLNRLRKELAT